MIQATSTNVVPAELAKEVPEVLAKSRAMVVVTPEGHLDAANWLMQIKAFGKRIAEVFAPMKSKAWEAHREIVAQEKKMLDPLIEAEQLTKLAMGAYEFAEESKRLAEQRRLQAEVDERARKERELLDQTAARQRQVEAEARAKADAARRAAEAEAASAAEKRQLVAQAEAAERKAAAAAAKVEESDAAAASVVAPVIEVAKTVAPIKGISSRQTWHAEVKDWKAFFDWVCTSRRDEFIAVNDKALQAHARAMGERASIPGVVFKAKSSIAARAAK
jgi:multidrug efflux pump subunit AcrA (membrane-fusion protein)